MASTRLPKREQIYGEDADSQGFKLKFFHAIWQAADFHQIWRMNYLAHAVLGGLEPQLALGNFIADAVKGRAWEQWPGPIAAGIHLHRAIDAFADEHPASAASRELIRPWLGRFAGVGLDLLHDHLLAREFGRFTSYPGSLMDFAGELEGVLRVQLQAMPDRSAQFFKALEANRWLVGYADAEVMRKVCASMDRRIEAPSDLVQTLTPLEQPELERLLVGHFEDMWHDMHQHLDGFPGRSWARVHRS